MLQIADHVAEFERCVMLERQGRHGQSRGSLQGPRSTARAQADDIERLAAGGVTKQAVANELGVGGC